MLHRNLLLLLLLLLLLFLVRDTREWPCLTAGRWRTKCQVSCSRLYITHHSAAKISTHFCVCLCACTCVSVLHARHLYTSEASETTPNMMQR